jgi:uncharacterized protein YdeI (YjbR/CyaY-like superfamily)
MFSLMRASLVGRARLSIDGGPISELTSASEQIDLNGMAIKDPRIDAYIAKSADFAKPILIHLRKLAHDACPGVEETLKWRMPHFVHQGILFGMAAFKQHCSVHFWNGKLVLGEAVRQDGMSHFGRVTTLSDLPGKKELLGYIKKAVELNESGVKKPAAKAGPKKKLVVPAYFVAALKKNKKAQVAFENFSYSHKKEYVEWITEAKRDETRAKRIETAIQWLAHGKSRNWKYANC